MRLFLCFILLTFNAWAVSWNDLEVSQDYKLTQSFQLPQLERSGSLLDISEGDRVTLSDIIPLDMINVVLLQFDYKKCPGSAMKTDMEIIPVKNTSPVVEIGAQLETGCKLEIFIESRDFMSESFFE